MLRAFLPSCMLVHDSHERLLQRRRAGFRSPVWWLQGVLESAYGPLRLPSKKRRAQSQAAAVQMLRQELAQVICLSGSPSYTLVVDGWLR